MARLLFSGIVSGDIYYQQITDGPIAGYSWNITELYLINNSGVSANVQLVKIIDGTQLVLFNGTIADGVVEELSEISLYEGQSLEVLTDQELSYSGYGTSTKQYPLRPEYDVWWDAFRDRYRGAIILDVEIGGTPTSVWFDVLDSIDLDIELGGDPAVPVGVDVSGDGIEFEIVLSGRPAVGHPALNWVGWSKIGQLQFTADMVNDAGYMPMDWSGVVYEIKRLDKNAIVYGSGGVTMLYPANEPMATYGKKNLLTHGIMSRRAVAGDEWNHFFVDTRGHLWHLSSEGLKDLGYEQYFSDMSNPIVLYDSAYNYVHVSDNEQGYLLTKDGLGGGYTNITGLLFSEGITKYMSPNTIGIDTLNMLTDVIDFGYRGIKTIESVQFGINADVAAQAAIDYRYRKDQAFVTSRWVTLSPEGVAFIRTAGTDFRVRLRLVTLGFCELSYINIQYKKTDHRYVRSGMGVHHGNNPTAA